MAGDTTAAEPIGFEERIELVPLIMIAAEAGLERELRCLNPGECIPIQNTERKFGFPWPKRESVHPQMIDEPRHSGDDRLPGFTGTGLLDGGHIRPPALQYAP